MSAILFDITMIALDCGIHIEDTYFIFIQLLIFFVNDRSRCKKNPRILGKMSLLFIILFQEVNLENKKTIKTCQCKDNKLLESEQIQLPKRRVTFQRVDIVHINIVVVRDYRWTGVQMYRPLNAILAQLKNCHLDLIQRLS